MVEFEHTGEWDFFGNDFQNQLPEHKGDCGPQSFAQLNASGFLQIFQTGSLDMAKYQEDGTEVDNDDVNFPFYLRFENVRTETNGVSVPPKTTEDTPWFEDLQGEGIPAGTRLFDVYAMDSRPTCDTRGCTPDIPQDIPTSELEFIGTIDTTTEFIQSLWADEHLYF
jgi:hypothetical protein